jgi:hypothetical protein
VDPYNKIGNKINTVALSHKTKWSVLGGRVFERVVSTLKVYSVAKCTYPFRILLLLPSSFLGSMKGILDVGTWLFNVCY